MSEKKVEITILSGCRGDGKSLEKGKTYKVSTSAATLAVGAGRAYYGKPPAKKQANKKAADASQDESKKED